MADQQEQPDERPAPATPARPPLEAPADVPPAAIKKAPAKKAPAKAVKKAVKKAEPTKTPAKKAVKAEREQPPVKAAPRPAPPTPPAPLAHTNGYSDVTEGAKVVAAEAKSTVEQAIDAVARPVPAPAETSRRVSTPLAVAFAISLLAVFLVRRLRGQSDDD